MEHKGTVELESTNFIMRKAVMSDIPLMYKNYTSNPNVSKYLTWQAHTSEDVTKDFVENFLLANYPRLDFYEWVIESKTSKEPVGMISVVKIDENIDEVYMGYCLSEQLWGRGYMKEVLTKVTKFLFEDVKVNRIAAEHDVNNPNSGKVMKKCGMSYEGTLRQVGKTNLGVYCDLAVYAILKKDYLGRETNG